MHGLPCPLAQSRVVLFQVALCLCLSARIALAASCCDAGLSPRQQLSCANAVVPLQRASQPSPDGKERLLILHLLTEQIRDYGAIAAVINANWAATFGHTLNVYEAPASKAVEAWSHGKVQLLADALKQIDKSPEAGITFLFYLDSDAILADFESDPFERLAKEFPSADLFVTREPDVKAAAARDDGGTNFAHGAQDFNTGTILLRVSEWSRNFLRHWGQAAAKDPDVNDQELLQVLYDSNFSGLKTRMAVLEPGATNSRMAIPVESRGQAVIHLAGIPNKVRLAVFGVVMKQVCGGSRERLAVEELQRVFLDEMWSATQDDRPSTGIHSVNSWLQVKQRLALTLETLGRKSEAIPLYEQVWKERCELFGNTSLDALYAQVHYARIHGGVEEQLSAWRGMQEVVGARQPEVKHLAGRIAGSLLVAGKLEELLEVCTELEESGSEDVTWARLVALNNLAIRRREKDRMSEAVTLLQAAAAGMTQQFGEVDPNTVRAKGNLVDALRASKRLTEASGLVPDLKFALTSRTLRKEDVKTTLDIVASVLKDLGRDAEAAAIGQAPLGVMRSTTAAPISVPRDTHVGIQSKPEMPSATVSTVLHSPMGMEISDYRMHMELGMTKAARLKVEGLFARALAGDTTARLELTSALTHGHSGLRANAREADKWRDYRPPHVRRGDQK